MSNFGTDQSKFKMILYLKNGDRKCFYSLLNEEKKGDQIALRNMCRRLLDKIYKGKYMTALIFDRVSDKVIEKYIDGKKEVMV